MKIVFENIIRYFLLFALQILLINQLHIFGWCHPALYVLCLLALPVNIPHWLELLLGFVTGFVMDIFCNSLGVHIAACVCIAYIRPFLIQKMVAEYERITSTPSMQTFGVSTFVRYVAILVLIHHSLLFSLEAFSFHNILLTLLEIIFSSLMTIALILGYSIIKR